MLSVVVGGTQINRSGRELKSRGVEIDPAGYTVEALERQLMALRKGGAGC